MSAGTTPDATADDVLLRYAQRRHGLFDRDERRDEMMDAGGALRGAWQDLGAVLREFGGPGLSERRESVTRMLVDDGVTYRTHEARVEQTWALDPVPLVLDETEWAGLEPAIAQRAELLDLVMTDLYGPRELIARGLIPPEVVYGHAGFVREVDQLRLPGPRQLILAAADLARGADGSWVALSDRTQAPSGAGYAMENRRIVARAMAGLYRSLQLRRVGPFFDAVRLAVQQIAPTADEAPRAVLLTSGAQSETAFDQAFLSSLLGFPLVTGADLVVQDGRVWQRSIGRLEPVDVILRRVDSWYCDPLELRPDSQLGTAGLIEATRLGNVSIVNGLGTGVLENPGLFPFLPAISQALLGEPLALPSVPTWWCGDQASRRYVLANLDRLVIKPIARSVTRTSRFGWELNAVRRTELAARIEARPWEWVAQEALPLSTVPTVGAGGLQARAMVLRSFAVAVGAGYQVMSGGLARAASDSQSMIVSNQEGSTSKDVWVLTRTAAAADHPNRPEHLAPERVHSAISPRVASDMFWFGRYAERAEDVARLVRVADNRWRDLPPDGGDPALARCLVVLLETLTRVTTTYPGFAGAAGLLADPRGELLSLLSDEYRVGTLAHDIRRTRELAGAVRDQLSNDTWLILSGLDRGLLPFWTTLDRPGGAGIPPQLWDTLDISAAISRLLESLLAFAGLAAESMVRDEGWLFMDAGRRIERALQVAGLLASCFTTVQAPQVEDLIVDAVVLTAESSITHRRRYAASTGVDTALELLIADPGNPRSIAYQLGIVAGELDDLPRNTGVAEARLQELSAAVRAAEPVRLAAVVDGARPALAGLLQRIQTELQGVATSIEGELLAQPALVQSFEAIVLESA